VTSVDESPREGEGAFELAERLAREKALAVVANGGLPVLTADTTVVCDGELLGKPASAGEARSMLLALSGRTHQVFTGVCVRHAGRLLSAVERTEVTFARLTPGQIDWYVATGEPMDKAGGYHIDGRGALFVSAISGSPSNVAGLPVALVARLLRETGVDIERLSA